MTWSAPPTKCRLLGLSPTFLDAKLIVRAFGPIATYNVTSLSSFRMSSFSHGLTWQPKLIRQCDHQQTLVQ